MLGPLGRFPERRLIVGMNSLDEFFHSRQTIPWIKTQNAVAFFRPIPDVGFGTPGPTARLTEPLRLRQISLALAQRFFSLPLVRDVSHRAHKFAVAECIVCCVSQGVDMLDSAIGQQQTIGMLESGGSSGSTFNY